MATLPYENATSGEKAVQDTQKFLRAFGCTTFGRGKPAIAPPPSARSNEMWLLTVFLVIQGPPQRLETVFSRHATQEQCVAKGWEAMRHGAIDFNCVPVRV